MRKSTFIFSTLMFLCLSSCSDDEPVLTTETWVLDFFDSLDIREFNTGENTKITLTLSTEDLCEANGVSILLQENGEIGYDELVSEFEFTLEYDVAKNAEINLTTLINVLPDSTFSCSDLGSVSCTLTY